ncbi:MAG TPA: ArsR family transcriptional regulator [Nitrososphaerales archaeon]|nr:ArsR family transcriptional regulator [Nitrososphaerales archaeon]
MRAFKYIHDPRAFEVVADETRRKMIYLLRVKEMTVSQLADQLGKTPQAIYHQIKKLIDTGLVEVAREERVDHFIETYYRATAEVFEFHHGEQDSRESEKELAEAFEALSKVGIELKVDPSMVAKAIEAQEKSSRLGLSPELEKKISELQEVGFMTKGHVYKFAQMALMSDKEFEEMVAAERALRKLITSSVTKRPKS